MIVFVVVELIYFIRRWRKKMKLRKAPVGESLSDKAHNHITTTENILTSLANQGVRTAEANSILVEAKRFAVTGDYTSAIERADAAKLALIRAKRERDLEPAAPARQPVQEGNTMVSENSEEEELVDLSKLPKNYMQAKFMLNTARDLIQKNNVKKGEAFDYYQKAKECFDAEDFSKALSFAIKAERLLDSNAVDLIGEEEPEEGEEEIVEVQVCSECDAEVSPDDAFCRSCGQKLELVTCCPGCEADIEVGDKFCRKCGHKL
jgi:ribosomal protein L40E